MFKQSKHFTRHGVQTPLRALSNLVINEPPLQVLPSLASKIGLNEAIVLQQIHYWLNPKFNKNYIQGRHWVFNTYEQWQEQFPFWSEITVRRTIGSLEKMNLLLTYADTSSFRHIKYYTINYDGLSALSDQLSDGLLEDKEKWNGPANNNPRSDQFDQIEEIKLSRPSDQNDQIELINLGSSYIETETTTENTLPPHKSPPQRPNKEEEELSDMMIMIWNDTVQTIHPISTTKVRLTDSRSEKLKHLLKNYFNSDLGEWSCYCEKIANSKYLMGKTDSKFVAGLDWAIQPTNALKILEGAIYDKPTSLQKKPEIAEQDFQKELEDHCQSISAPEGWVQVCQKLTNLHGQSTFRSWFKKLTPKEISGKIIHLDVETRFIKDYISVTYSADLGRVLGEIYPQSDSFEIGVSKSAGQGR